MEGKAFVDEPHVRRARRDVVGLTAHRHEQRMHNVFAHVLASVISAHDFAQDLQHGAPAGDVGHQVGFLDVFDLFEVALELRLEPRHIEIVGAGDARRSDGPRDARRWGPTSPTGCRRLIPRRD